MPHVANVADAGAICISNADKQIIFCSGSHLTLLGRQRRDIIGSNWQSWMPDEAAIAVQDQFTRFWRTREPYGVLTHALQADGTPIALVAQCSIIEGKTAACDLLFCEVERLDVVLERPDAERFACATMVRDLTYELARHTGHNRFATLTNDLLAASASAERAVEMLANVHAELLG